MYYLILATEILLLTTVNTLTHTHLQTCTSTKITTPIKSCFCEVLPSIQKSSLIFFPYIKAHYSFVSLLKWTALRLWDFSLYFFFLFSFSTGIQIVYVPRNNGDGKKPNIRHGPNITPEKKKNCLLSSPHYFLFFCFCVSSVIILKMSCAEPNSMHLLSMLLLSQVLWLRV